MQYPATRVNKHEEVIHGNKVTDNFRWLEADDSPAVDKWSAAQNEFTLKSIDKSWRQKFDRELRQSFNFRTATVPHKVGELYFWQERQPKEEQAILYVKKGLQGRKKTLIDPNKLSGKDIVTLDFWYPSVDGQYLAYGLSRSGDELSQLKVMDVKTAQNLETVSTNASGASVCWLPDSSGFFYTDHPKVGTVPAGEERLHHKVRFHKLDDKDSDQIIFGEHRSKEEMYHTTISLDGKWLIISAQTDWERNNLYLYDVEKQDVSELLVGLEGYFYIGFSSEKAILYTNYQASNGRLMIADIEHLPTNINDWKELVSEQKDKLEWFQLTRDKILLTYLINATQRTYIFNYDGSKKGELPLVEHGSMLSTSGDSREAEFFYEYASFITPGVINCYDPATNSYLEYDRKGSTIKEQDYVVKQELYSSKDGVRVPMFIVHHKGVKLDGTNPTLLYGYGGFELSVTPGFLRSHVAWLKRGGVYAAANIRGGGEFGKEWHLAGIREKKQKSYDDFIYAAKHLIKRKYTNNQHLGIFGGSNGGLLVVAVAVQAPELFKAVLAKVPLTDMVRFPYSLIASRWTAEYGDPEKKKDLQNILKFSPYHNVKNSVDYPSFLLATGRHDTRVHPMHARKMAALLQSVSKNNLVLLHTDMKAGHLGSLTMENLYTNQSLELAFMAQQLGLKSPLLQ